MDLLEEVRAKLKRVPIRGLSDFARRAKIPYGTIRAIKVGRSVSPRYMTLQKLSAALEDESKLLPRLPDEPL